MDPSSTCKQENRKLNIEDISIEEDTETEFFKSALKYSGPRKPAPAPTPRHICERNRKRHLESLDKLFNKTVEPKSPNKTVEPQSPKVKLAKVEDLSTSADTIEKITEFEKAMQYCQSRFQDPAYIPPQNQLDDPAVYALYQAQFY